MSESIMVSSASFFHLLAEKLDPEVGDEVSI
jgi:hypothetical protein